MFGSAAKQKFLVVYDYGQGGVWAFVWARTADEIHTRFRDLKVIDSMPSWLVGEELAVTEQRMTFDIDDVKPDDWIAQLLRPGQGEPPSQ
jgi:hypothetical protein